MEAADESMFHTDEVIMLNHTVYVYYTSRRMLTVRNQSPFTIVVSIPVADSICVLLRIRSAGLKSNQIPGLSEGQLWMVKLFSTA